MENDFKILVGGVGAEPDVALAELLKSKGYPVAGCCRDEELLARARQGRGQIAVVRAPIPMPVENEHLLRSLVDNHGISKLLLLSDQTFKLAAPDYSFLRIPGAATEEDIIDGIERLTTSESPVQWVSEVN